jgi:hypothetical protein
MVDTPIKLVLQLLYVLFHALQPVLVPICFLSAWAIVAMVGWSLWAAFRDGVQNAQRMHQIPCANCEFFTGDYHLKCTVHPSRALSEEAIHCLDYEPADRPFTLDFPEVGSH